MENGHAHANDDDSNIDALLEERQRMMGKLFNNAVPEEYAERYMRTRQLIHKFNVCMLVCHFCNTDLLTSTDCVLAHSFIFSMH